MKKLLFLFLFMVVFNCTINAQRTNSYPENPPRFEILNAVRPGLSNFQLIIDSQSGVIISEF